MKTPRNFRGVFISNREEGRFPLIGSGLDNDILFDGLYGLVGILRFERNGERTRSFEYVSRIRFDRRNAAVSEIPNIGLDLAGRTRDVEVHSGTYDTGRYAGIDLEAFRNVLDDDLSGNGIFRSVILDDRKADLVLAGIVVPDSLNRVALCGNPARKPEIVDELGNGSFLSAACRTVELNGRRSVVVLIVRIRGGYDNVRYERRFFSNEYDFFNHLAPIFC